MGQLGAAKNYLESLPESIGFLLNLEELSLSRNRLKSICASVGRLRSQALKKIFIKDNAGLAFPQPSVIEEGSDAILECLESAYDSLENAWASGTASFEGLGLVTLPPELCNDQRSKMIVRLSLARNCLSALPDALSSLIGLRVFDASHNMLSTVPSALGTLGSLTSLLLKGNPIKFLPGELANCEYILVLTTNNRVAVRRKECNEESRYLHEKSIKDRENIP